jgi:hypothetical protein
MGVRYRILSTCAGLGYGFPEQSFRNAMEHRLDLIAADAGSIDPGPFYLGAGQSYMKRINLARDFSIMLKGAITQRCPLIIGSCGLAGDDPNLDFMVSVVKDVFEDLKVSNLKVAVISAHAGEEVFAGRVEELEPIGPMPALSLDVIRSCRKVGQMGIAPFVEALNLGAQVILAGRACDVAIFAADPIRQGIAPGLAFHAGHILECGAIACEPGSGSDCLIAEFMDNNSVVFTPPNPVRKATVISIAAHSLYEEDHPDFQVYPEGMLSMERTQYFSAGDRSAGIRNSSFLRFPTGIKMEGAHQIGERVVSILRCRVIDNLPLDFIVYGRNGVSRFPVGAGESEVGLCIHVRSTDQEAAKTQLTLVKGLWMHFGYPGRRSTAGNLAFPMSPSEIDFKDQDGSFVSAIIAGSRDPFFQQALPQIKKEIREILQRDYPDLQARCDTDLQIATRENPYLFLDTWGPSVEEAKANHRQKIKDIEPFVDIESSPVVEIYAGGFFIWGIYHRLTDSEPIQQHLFPISLYKVDGSIWTSLEVRHAKLEGLGEVGSNQSLFDSDRSKIEDAAGTKKPIGSKALIDMANVIRSKNAGINKICYDLFFNTDQDYAAALRSGCFTQRQLARTLGIPVKRIIGSYRCDACRAIKVSTHREILSGSPGDRDLFGAQQHTKLLAIKVPLYAS